MSLAVAAPRRGFGAAALALVVATLSITLGFVAAGPRADAFAPIPVPVAIGETLAGPAAETLAGGVCVGSVVCGLAVGAVALGAVAYSTRDHWLPAVKKLFADDTTTQGAIAAKPDTCGTSWQFDAKYAGGKISGKYTWAGGCFTYGTYVTFTRWSCTDGNGKVVKKGTYDPATGRGDNAGSIYLNDPDPTKKSGTKTYEGVTPCASGTTLSDGEVIGVHSTGGSQAFSTNYVFGGPVPDDQFSQTTTVTCVGGAAGTGKKVTRTQIGHPDQVLIPSCASEYPGSYPSEIEITGGRQGAESPLEHRTLMDPRSSYPDCFDASGAFLPRSCNVRVWINGQPCTRGASHCSSWDTADQDFGDQVECRFGKYVVQLDDCDLLKRQYEPGAGTKTLTVTDPKTGQAADPRDVPATSTNPGTQAGGQTGTSTFPSTGTNPSTGVPGGAPATGTDPSTETDNQNCWGSGWSWNPVSWVFVPVRCALKWAFVPPAGTFTMTDVMAQFATRPPGSVVTEVGAGLKSTFGAYSGSSGCAPVGFGSQSGRALEVRCDGLRSTGVGQALYSLAGVAVIVGAGIACWRIVAGAVDR